MRFNYLFDQTNLCLNLGGFANISSKGKTTQAFDICPANIVLNAISSQLGYPYDPEGKLARSGQTDEQLLEQLNDLEFYKKTGSKSLGREWVEEQITPLLEASGMSPSDQLSTVTEHIAIQIKNSIESIKGESVLVTGGGTFNTYLLSLLNDSLTECKIVIPEPEIIEFKEAIIFAFLALRKLQNKTTALASVTGASQDSSGGVVNGALPAQL